MKTNPIILRTTTAILAICILTSCATSQGRVGGLPASTKVTRDSTGKYTVTANNTADALFGMEMAARGMVAPTPVPATSAAASSSKTREDLEAEKEMRRKIKNNEFIPGYQGGAVKYSTGSGVKTFVP